MRLSLFFSPCPNDTFMFDAMVHQKVDTEGLQFETLLADVEALNHQAFKETAVITKLSFHAYAHVADKYKILPSGSALGYGNGPLLVSKRKIYPDELNDAKIAIPGKYTTAALLLKIAFPQATNFFEYLFSDIEEAVLSNEMDAGALIHEGRFTYAKKGLKLIADLGQLWEERTSRAIPLGCIAVSRKLDNETQQKIARVLRRSIEFSMQNPQESADFVKQNAQELDAQVTAQHIKLYVTNRSIDLGNEGRKSVQFFFEEALKAGIIKSLPQDIFV